MYIDKNEIKKSFKTLGEGSFSKVFLAIYNNQKYAYKVFDDDIYFVDEYQTKRYEELCKRYDGSSLLLPKLLIGNTNIEGYLTDYYKGCTFDKLFMYNIEEKIKYTHLGKDLLKKVYKNKGIVHSDIHFGQFMFDPKKGTVALLDFDNSKINDLVPYKRYLSSFAREFLGYNDYDKYLDIHLFNLLTFALLNNMSMSVAFSNLKNPKCNMLFTSKNALKLLEDISIYKRNNNYLIDMIDEKQVQKIKNKR